MLQTVESNRTLLVDGPASVRLASGKAEVFGCQIKQASKVVVSREGKRVPFHVLEKAVFNVSLGGNASLQETEGNTIPASWNKPVEAVLAVQKRPVIIMVLGQTDSGKSSLCTYMVNKLVDGKSKVAVLDGDLGQSDIGPSAALGYAVTSKPITELYDLKLENGFFVGVTSPLTAFAKAVEGLVALQAEVLKRQVDFILINTDGWITGEVALRHKCELIKQLKPDVLVGVQVGDELAPLMARLESASMVMVEPSPALNPRSGEKRKVLREMTYGRYLKGARVQCYPVSQLIVEPRNAIPHKQEPEKGVLVGLYSRSKFLGIGVLREINLTRHALKVQTSISATPNRLVFGKVFLNQKLQEI